MMLNDTHETEHLILYHFQYIVYGSRYVTFSYLIIFVRFYMGHPINRNYFQSHIGKRKLNYNYCYINPITLILLK